MLPANLSVLRSRFPVVLARILDSSSNIPKHFRYYDSPKGVLLKTIQGDREFPSHGPNKPDRLIERWFNNLQLKKESLYMITGFGDGMHIRHFLKNSSGGTYVMVCEKDPALLRETFSVSIVQISYRTTEFCLAQANVMTIFLKICNLQQCLGYLM